MTNAASLCRTPGVLRYYVPGPPDERNDPTDTYNDVDVMCRIQMRARQEVAPEGEVSATTWLAYFPPSVVPPKAADELTVEGTTYQFRGDGWLAHGTTGQADHVEGTLELAA